MIPNRKFSSFADLYLPHKLNKTELKEKISISNSKPKIHKAQGKSIGREITESKTSTQDKTKHPPSQNNEAQFRRNQSEYVVGSLKINRFGVFIYH